MKHMPDDPCLEQVGEFDVIARISASLPSAPGVLLGPGDDTAVVAAPDGRVALTTDMLVEGTHFRLDWSSAEDVGHKAAAANLADIAAMGAVPTAIVVAFGAPGTLHLSWVLGCSAALRDEAALAGAAVVGGDVVAAERVIVSVTAIGDLRGRSPILRSGARPGDVLAIAGRIGCSAAGLALLQAGLGAAEAVACHRRPQPPYAAGPAAALAGATAMIDVSDGLVADARHLAQASGVVVAVETARLAPEPAVRQAAELLGDDPWAWILHGGEDHALLATFPEDVRLPEPFVPIGRIHAIDTAVLQPSVTVDGERWERGGGFDHFAGEAGWNRA